MFFEINVMYSSLFDAVFADSFFSPMRTVYVVSDSQLEEIKRNQRQEELDNIEASRKRLEESIKLELRFLMIESMNFKRRSKLLLLLRRRKRKSLLSKYGLRMRDDHEGAISPLFYCFLCMML